MKRVTFPLALLISVVSWLLVLFVWGWTEVTMTVAEDVGGTTSDDNITSFTYPLWEGFDDHFCSKVLAREDSPVAKEAVTRTQLMGQIALVIQMVIWMCFWILYSDTISPIMTLLLGLALLSGLCYLLFVEMSGHVGFGCIFIKAATLQQVRIVPISLWLVVGSTAATFGALLLEIFDQSSYV